MVCANHGGDEPIRDRPSAGSHERYAATWLRVLNHGARQPRGDLSPPPSRAPTDDMARDVTTSWLRSSTGAPLPRVPPRRVASDRIASRRVASRRLASPRLASPRLASRFRPPHSVRFVLKSAKICLSASSFSPPPVLFCSVFREGGRARTSEIIGSLWRRHSH